MMKPREIIAKWVKAFNLADSHSLAELYSENAVNHQVPNVPVVGRDAIQLMFEKEFTNASMTCEIEHIFEDGQWVILEWKDPNGLRGCGFFKIENGLIVFQRGYWDKLSFVRLHNMPIPAE